MLDRYSNRETILSIFMFLVVLDRTNCSVICLIIEAVPFLAHLASMLPSTVVMWTASYLTLMQDIWHVPQCWQLTVQLRFSLHESTDSLYISACSVCLCGLNTWQLTDVSLVSNFKSKCFHFHPCPFCADAALTALTHWLTVTSNYTSRLMC